MEDTKAKRRKKRSSKSIEKSDTKRPEYDVKGTSSTKQETKVTNDESDKSLTSESYSFSD